MIESFSSNLAVLPSPIKTVELLGSKEPVNWTLTNKGLKIQQPKSVPNQYALTYKINLLLEEEVGIGGEDPGTNGE